MPSASRLLAAAVLLLGLVDVSGFSAAQTSVAGARTRPRRVGPVLALDVGSAIESASNLLAAQVLGLDTNPYGGTGAFSQSETGAAGDLNIIILIGVVFPTVLTLVFYKDNIFAAKEEEEPPKGWQKVPSRSRPGKFSFKNMKTGQVYDRLPRSAFFDDDVLGR